jgi:type III restriction enzyme
MAKIKFKFDPNQEHQLTAVDSVLRLFDKLPQGHSEFKLGDELVPNLPAEETFDEDILLANLNEIQRQNKLSENRRLDVDDGLVLESIGNESWRYPVFTIEMETGTGKTYVYLRTAYELRKRYGFRKFIVIVPSIAIYEGVIKSIEITREHFKSLYNNEHMNVIAYDSEQISKLRDFANSQFLQVMIMTMASFNRYSNNIYKRTEKLPGEKIPVQYVQETRPILILDESQNYVSQTSKEALRTLHPLLAIKYSATPGEKISESESNVMRYDNLLYRLTPVDAFKLNLVKRIQVYGVTEKDVINNELSMTLNRIYSDLTAEITLILNNKGQLIRRELRLKKDDDLGAKTRNELYKGFIIEEINRRDGKVIFSNGWSISLHDQHSLTPARQEIFRVQIEETVRQHLNRQAALLDKGIKVLSLFFIDRVASYIEEEGVVKKLFDIAFEKLKSGYSFFEKKKAEDVREAYFAKKKTKEGEVAFDTSGRNEEERKAEKEAFELIMKNKEQLLSIDEKVCFVFAHSALKEGWDNPNVFQICTLRDTVSEMRKRQEIGRGMRLCVNQDGDRISNSDINVLTVVANESYESFASGLQREYAEAGEAIPQKPSDARRAPAKRNNSLYKSPEFNAFWEKLIRTSKYALSIDTEQVVKDAIARFSKESVPPPQILIKRGKYVITHFEIKLISVSGMKAVIEIGTSDTLGQEETRKKEFSVRDDLAQVLREQRLRGYKIVNIVADKDEPRVEFADGPPLTKDEPRIFDTEEGQKVDSRTVLESAADYSIFNLIDRSSRETFLTRPTIIRIFSELSDGRKKEIFSNPEGFAGRFIFVIKEVVADHLAKNIRYTVDAMSKEDYDKEELFPPQRSTPQKELISASGKSLYDVVQIDSDVEKRFVENRLNVDPNVVLYFKFPPKFKINMPKIIGNYNPDWGIIRLSEDSQYKLELVRETKGFEMLKAAIGAGYENLRQVTNEKRKIICAGRHFKQLGISYRDITPEMVRWWEDATPEEDDLFVKRILDEIEESLKFDGGYLPVYSLAAACGKFREGHTISPEGWIKADIGRKLDADWFVSKVLGHSMEPRIPHNSYCVFRKYQGGPRGDLIVLAQHSSIADPESGGSYTVKRYKSEKMIDNVDSWKHGKIMLESLNPAYKTIIIPEDIADEFKVIAEFITVLP